MADLKDLFTAVVEMQEDTAMELTNKYLDEGVPALDIFNCYQEALEEIGKRFEKQLYFIPELIMSGEMMKAASEILKPHLSEETSASGGQKKLGKVLMATVQGDIHDIGKNIASMMLDLNGLEVKDIGVDVPAETIIAEAQAFGADVIGLSGLLTLAFDPMKAVVDKLEEQGLRDKIKVLIGGGQMDEQVCNYVGADAYVTDAVVGVNYIKGWLS
ncbi:cobalamin B12-binding domain-containing protein [Desulfoferula mesophila]|uniref:Cobalamin-binding protein n=1 Tax=Desulfoferula mesophila TaxID=3058419 RepID=A0AAU9EA14_9BACT|nr:cobalamin-binding protein [Desulfoferula mesophilus]